MLQLTILFFYNFEVICYKKTTVHFNGVVVKLSENLWLSLIILILLHRFNGVLK